jgi:hypothetical protein
MIGRQTYTTRWKRAQHVSNRNVPVCTFMKDIFGFVWKTRHIESVQTRTPIRQSTETEPRYGIISNTAIPKIQLSYHHVPLILNIGDKTTELFE